jgi:hypothetical protein
MLKLHHMNLLNEIQETTLMMNLYQQQQLQQQQLQQQQQQLQQHPGTDFLNSDPSLQMMLQQDPQGGFDSMYGSGLGQSRRGSLGFGMGGGAALAQLQHQQQLGLFAGAGQFGQVGLGSDMQTAMDRIAQLRQEELQREQMLSSGGFTASASSAGQDSKIQSTGITSPEAVPSNSKRTENEKELEQVSNKKSKTDPNDLATDSGADTGDDGHSNPSDV